MEITGYKFITGKKVPRPWGIEYRFTVEKADETRIDDVITLPREEMAESEIASLIEEFLAIRDAPPLPIVDPIEEAKALKEEEITEFLRSKGFLKDDETVWDIKFLSKIVLFLKKFAFWEWIK